MALDNLSEEVDLYYLKYYLEYRKLDDVISGSAQPQITGKGLSKVKIPLPPLDQQKKIASILDAADAYKQKTKALIEKYDELTQSLFLDMFGDPFLNTKAYDFVQLETVAEKVQIGPFGSQLHKSDYVTGGIPLINPTHIFEKDIVEDNDFTLAKEKYEELPNYHLKQGDVVMGRRGEMGRGALITERTNGWFCGTGSLYVRPSNKLNPTFLLYLITEAAGVNYLEHNAKGVTMKNLNKTIINQMSFGLPSIEEQNQFAGSVQAIEVQKAQAQASLAQAEDLFNSLLQRAFKGELV